MKQLKPFKTSKTSNPEVCPFVDLVYPRWKGVAHELGYCEALHFKVLMPKSVVESKCKTGAPCDYREAGKSKDDAIVKGLKAKRRKKSIWHAARKF